MSENRSTPLINRYDAGGALLPYAVFGLDPTHQHARTGPGAWSIAELVAHLSDAELVYSERMKRVIAENDPVFQGFDPATWVERLGERESTVEDAVNLFVTNRRWMTQILRRLSDDDFARAGQHKERGRMTLAALLATVTNHLDHHLTFLYAKRAKLGVAVQPRYSLN